MKRGFLCLLAAVYLILGIAPLGTHAAGNEQTKASISNQAKIKLMGDLRKLWIDHTIWTRSYIVSAIAGLEDQSDVLERLLRNQQDIGNAIKPYYGEQAGNKLAELLTEHIVIAGKVVDAAIKGDQAAFTQQNKEWYRNADDIAQFLSSANPNWTKKEIQDLMYVHLQLLTDQVVARLKKDWKTDIAAFDKGEEHIIKLADTLTEGIMKQFPDKF